MGSGVVRLRMAVWVIRQIMAGQPDTGNRLRSGALGALAMAAGGALAAIVIILLLALLMMLAHEAGWVTPIQAMLAGWVLLAGASYALFHYGRTKIERALNPRPYAAQRKSRADVDVVQEVVNGFLSGLLMGKNPKAAASPAKTPEAPVQETGDLFDKESKVSPIRPKPHQAA